MPKNQHELPEEVIVEMRKHLRYIDYLERGFYCLCGKPFYPDCDASRVSINQAHWDHQDEVLATFNLGWDESGENVIVLPNTQDLIL